MRKEDIPTFSDSISTAYEGYPFFDYLFDGGYNKPLVEEIFNVSMNIQFPNLVSLSADNKASSVAIFIPSKFTNIGGMRYLFNGGFGLIGRMGMPAAKRMSRYEKYTLKIMKENINDDAWYVFNFCTRPEYRHTGLSSSTMRPMLDYLDRVKKSLYLETHKKENVAMYEHFGFKVVNESKISGSDCDFYAMLRTPQ